ncbi:MAG: hypothetical protein RLY93_06400 [Sumerlaeia bacterium]
MPSKRKRRQTQESRLALIGSVLILFGIVFPVAFTHILGDMEAGPTRQSLTIARDVLLLLFPIGFICLVFGMAMQGSRQRRRHRGPRRPQSHASPLPPRRPKPRKRKASPSPPSQD